MRIDEVKNWYIKVTRPDYGGAKFCVYSWPGKDLVENELDDCEEGEMIQLELVRMTEKEFEDLGEFKGW